jgi:hypothetical protein
LSAAPSWNFCLTRAAGEFADGIASGRRRQAFRSRDLFMHAIEIGPQKKRFRLAPRFFSGNAFVPVSFTPRTRRNDAVCKARLKSAPSALLVLRVPPLRAAVGRPVAPFFRFPELQHSPRSFEYLAQRNIAVFSTDIDSRDFTMHRPEQVMKTVMSQLEKQCFHAPQLCETA